MFELNSELAWACILLIYFGEFALYVESFSPPHYHSTVTGNKETQYKRNQMQRKKPNAKKPVQHNLIQSSLQGDLPLLKT
jgi:hypothetical protein